MRPGKNMQYINSSIIAFIFSCLFSLNPVYSAESKFINNCLDAMSSILKGSKAAKNKETIKKASILELVTLIAIDDETAALVQNPWIAQYIFVNYFAEGVGANEVKEALQQLVNSTEAKNVDIFNLVNEKLANKLNDPEVQAKVKKALDGKEDSLRPSSTSTKFTNFKSRIKQALALRTTISRVRKLTDEGLSMDVMDRGLFDFYGATQLGLKESQLRRWEIPEGGYSAIRPGQIQNMSADVFSKIALFASETEAPIHGYSTNSGNTLRGLSPSLSAFMGKNEEEYLAYVAKEELGTEEVGPFCTNVWCSEEKRHEMAIQTVGEQISGVKANAEKTFESEPMGDFTDAEFALKHLVGRNSSEWNANSAYFLMRAHSEGAANTMVDNVRQDETKHMAIFSAAYKYFYGNQYTKRLKGMIEKIAKLSGDHADGNSNSSILKNEGLTLFEAFITHIFVEKRVQRFMKSIPLKTMEKLFDTPVKTIKEIESMPLSADKQKLIDEMIVREKAKRARLARWTPKERKKYLELKNIEEENAALIESLIRNLFNNFTGAEVVGSADAKAVINKIGKLRTGLDRKTNKYIQESLRETFRDYQIMNNSFVRSKPDLRVRLKSATEGFIVEKRALNEVDVLDVKKITDTHALLRVKKPNNIELEAGSALKVSLAGPNGPVTRILSLSSDPSKEYIEIAVGISDSEFKQSLLRLQGGDVVQVENAGGGLNFQYDKPAVMIAAGIGITPFRSIIEQSARTGFNSPVSLVFGNRNQIPFKEQLETIAADNNEFELINVLSQADDTWNGLRGRIDDALLSNIVENSKPGSVYYIVTPVNMIAQVTESLRNLGVENERIVIESFGPGSSDGADNLIARSADSDDGQAVAAREGSDEDEVVCFCQSVTAGQITTAVAAGANSLGDIQTATGAVTGCGNCKCNVMGIVNSCRN